MPATLKLFSLWLFLKKRYRMFSIVIANLNTFLSKTFYFSFENSFSSQMICKQKLFRFESNKYFTIPIFIVDTPNFNTAEKRRVSDE